MTAKKPDPKATNDQVTIVLALFQKKLAVKLDRRAAGDKKGASK